MALFAWFGVQVRVFGLENSGYVAPTLDVFIGTFNTADSKPPLDPMQLARWIPPRKVSWFFAFCIRLVVF
jgi:hypothetical protein